jgi:hypothetical protein
MSWVSRGHHTFLSQSQTTHRLKFVTDAFVCSADLDFFEVDIVTALWR